MFIKKCDFKYIKILAKRIHVQNTYTVVTSLLLVFDYHARNTLTLYYLCRDYLLKNELTIQCILNYRSLLKGYCLPAA
jgi:hypothetical protein